MQFDPQGFIEYAEEILQSLAQSSTSHQSMEQAKVRTSISRAYYGAYLFTREKLCSTGKFEPTGRPSDHGTIVGVLKGSGPDDIGAKLDSLRKKRNDADYKLDLSEMTQKSAAHWINIARQIMALLQKGFSWR